MQILENVDAFIAKTKYSILVKKFGLPYVLNKWKKACEDMPFRKEYLIYEYLNNLCTRNVLEEIFTHCDASDEERKILADCDNLFKKKTVVVKESVWEKKDDGPILHWYNYRIPKEHILDWFPEGLKIVES
ncbi:hypothetical protein [Treponema pedis]|uniref:hypothetical protein n=1 Tax=Treponema pedis TaxID=409322 RepID=UPI0004212006|nr:hypothetical protein [Treponema pedis]